MQVARLRVDATGRILGRLVFIIIGLSVSWVVMNAALDAETQSAPPTVRITVVYDNVPHAPGLTTAWGFSAVVESADSVVLFDTGGDGPTLLGNLKQLGVDLAAIDAVVLSHIHGDHTGGLDSFLSRQSHVTVYLPRSFPAYFRRSTERRGGHVETVSGRQRLFANFYSTGEMGDDIREQMLIVDSPAGLVVIAGCAHPGVVEMARAARSYLGKDIYLLMGGFHLRGRDAEDIHATVDALRRLGVRHVAPSHCTGDAAIRAFRDAWGRDFVESGLGAVIDVP